MVLLFIGASGSGKDTQADLLSEEYGFSVVSSGEALRAEVDSGSTVGRKIEEVMAEGEWVDDKTVFEVLEEYLRTKVNSEELIFTGAVRTLEQVPMFDEMLKNLGLELNGVVYLELDDQTAVERLMGRGREDDTPDAIKQRLHEFHEDNKQILSAYEERELLLRINASGTIHAISESIKKKLRLPMHNGIEVQIKKLIVSALKSKFNIEIATSEIHLEHPADLSHGDWATNVAMRFAKEIGTNPREVAQTLVDAMILDMSDDSEPLAIQEMEVAGPGFINFKLSSDHYLNLLNEMLSNTDFGKNEDMAGRKVVVEFTDPNPFKEFHIGHLYSNSVGESISRLLEAQGAELKRANYQGDVGLHVAMSIWGLRRKLEEDKSTLEDLGTRSIKEIMHYLGQSYALGATAYEDEAEAEEEIKQLNKEIFEKTTEIPEYALGRKWSLEYFEWIYERLGTKFDLYFFESEVGENGKHLVEEYLARGVFVESKGAVIFPGEKVGLHNRVFINSLGLPTYEAKELGLAIEKHERFDYDLSVIVTGNEINDYFQVLMAALKQIRPDLEERTKHIGHGMVRLPEGKMSSRTGKILTGEWLIEEAKSMAQEKITADSMSAEEKDSLAEAVAVGAIKYAMLRHAVGGDIEFSFEESISFEGNSGPYLQYSLARSLSVLEKAGIDLMEFEPNGALNEEELLLLKALSKFPEVVQQAGADLEPHQLCNYLYELAQQFNTFYNKHQIVGESQLRAVLTQAFANVMRSGLHMLGIGTPERM